MADETDDQIDKRLKTLGLPVAPDENFRVQFALAQARLTRVPRETRMLISGILRDLSSAVVPLDDRIARNALRWIATVLEHDENK